MGRPQPGQETHDVDPFDQNSEHHLLWDISQYGHTTGRRDVALPEKFCNERQGNTTLNYKGVKKLIFHIYRRATRPLLQGIEVDVLSIQIYSVQFTLMISALLILQDDCRLLLHFAPVPPLYMTYIKPDT